MTLEELEFHTLAHGTGSLSGYDLLRLATGNDQRAEAIKGQYRSLMELQNVDPSELIKLKGIGPKTASRVSAIFALANMVIERSMA